MVNNVQNIATQRHHVICDIWRRCRVALEPLVAVVQRPHDLTLDNVVPDELQIVRLRAEKMAEVSPTPIWIKLHSWNRATQIRKNVDERTDEGVWSNPQHILPPERRAHRHITCHALMQQMQLIKMVLKQPENS